MGDPDLLVPAIVVFVLMVLGLALTIREFYAERGLDEDPVDHTPKIVKPSPDQVRPVE